MTWKDLNRNWRAAQIKLLRDAIDAAGGNVAKAAGALDMSRVYLWRLVKKYGLRAPRPRGNDEWRALQ